MHHARTYRSHPRRREPAATRMQALLDRLGDEPVVTFATCLAAVLLILAVAVDAWGRNAVLSEPVAAERTVGEET